jgi:DNA modification methylase
MQLFSDSAATTKVQARESDDGDSRWLDRIDSADKATYERWQDRLLVQPSLSRALVSFQANKNRAVYRWFKYKEAFSADLVDYLLQAAGVDAGRLLDPFAGSGTALFAAAQRGLTAHGIELLPIGQTIIETKRLIESELRPNDIHRIGFWRDTRPWHSSTPSAINELKITRGAYSVETRESIGRFVSALEAETSRLRVILRFALLCVLEQVSFTRKDGQYLRWDHRSGRSLGKKLFNKGLIPSFDRAISAKLDEMIADLRDGSIREGLFSSEVDAPPVTIQSGSCLTLLPTLPGNSFDCLLTSPPYCNRYDYTRTYALELAALGIDEAGLRALRQDMLSCTVENRAKDLIEMNSNWERAIRAVEHHALLQAILEYLDSKRLRNQLNNDGIPRMVRGYFSEMACVIAECGRVLKPGAPLIMVNDNVRYAGASISVDLILSELAENLGFTVDRILVLPGRKGNSSQQMGEHGREALRKCVYIWRKI